MNMSRREFLKKFGIGAASAVILAAIGSKVFTFQKITTVLSPQFVTDPLKEYPYRSWEDLYRKQWTWDNVGFATHSLGCVGGCSWQVFTKSGIPLREEQTNKYPQLPNVPVVGPRGCQKGASYTRWIQQGDFIKYPLKRIGNRGERKWKRVSWDEALDDIAGKIIEVITKDGPGNTFHTNRVFALINNCSTSRFAALLGGMSLDVSSYVGDLYPGVQTVRVPGRTVSTFDDWFTSDLIIMWHMNPVMTRIPDAHYLFEAKYNGARLVTISPDYNPSSIHADLYIPVRVGTDSYLASAIVNQLIFKKKYKEDYVKEQSDLPFLVKENGDFLRQSDLISNGNENVFYVWDQSKNTYAEVSNKTRDLKEVKPALESSFDVKGIHVTTVFEKIKQEIQEYTPEYVQKITGIHPSVIYKLTDWIVNAKAFRILDGYNNQKHFDGFQTGRLKMLIMTLTGHHGTTGSLDTTYEGWKFEGETELKKPKGKKSRSVSGLLEEWVIGDHFNRSKSYFNDQELKDKLGYGITDINQFYKRSLKEKWMPAYQEEYLPKFAMITAVNYFRHVNGSIDFKDKFLKKNELFVVTDIRMSGTAMWADYVLPAATDYEKFDARETSTTRFVHLFSQPVKPMGERKTDWSIYVELTRKIQEKAKAKKIGSIPDKELNTVIELDKIYDQFTLNGKIAKDKDALKYLFENSKALGSAAYQQILKDGFVGVGPEAGKTSLVPKDKPYRPFVDYVKNKKPYNTLTGRLQFYIDQTLFKELGQMVPKPQYAGGYLGPQKYPFVHITPHCRWGVHSSYRTEKYLLRLQRGMPYVCVSPKTLQAKGLKDGDTVKVFNNLGEYEAMVKALPGLPDYIVYTEFGWELYQFKPGTHYNNLGADLINPLELAGNYGQVKYSSGGYNPNRIYHETTVDIIKS